MLDRINDRDAVIVPTEADGDENAAPATTMMVSTTSRRQSRSQQQSVMVKLYVLQAAAAALFMPGSTRMDWCNKILVVITLFTVVRAVRPERKISQKICFEKIFENGFRVLDESTNGRDVTVQSTIVLNCLIMSSRLATGTT